MTFKRHDWCIMPSEGCYRCLVCDLFIALEDFETGGSILEYAANQYVSSCPGAEWRKWLKQIGD